MSMNPFHPSKAQVKERQELSGAFRGGEKPRTSFSRAAAGQLLPHYVYGHLTQLESNRWYLDAPLSGLVIQELFTFDAATEVYSLYGPDLSSVPAGARIEAGTPEAMRNEDGTRHANWVNVNAILTHGDVIAVDDEDTITLQQAHGGSVRTLLVDTESTLNTRTGDIHGIQPGDHLFITGLTETAELSCPRIHIIVINQTERRPSPQDAEQ